MGAYLLVIAGVIGFAIFSMAAPRIKDLSDRQRAITLPALFRKQWKRKTRMIASIIIVAIFAAALAANFLAAGTILHTTLGAPLRVSIALLGLVVIGYSIIGGFRGIVWTDIVQMLLIVGSVSLLFIGLLSSVGLSTAIGQLPSGHLDISTLPLPLLISYLLVGIFAFFGSQDLFQRVYAAKSRLLDFCS